VLRKSPQEEREGFFFTGAGGTASSFTVVAIRAAKVIANTPTGCTTMPLEKRGLQKKGGGRKSVIKKKKKRPQRTEAVWGDNFGFGGKATERRGE